MTHSFQRSARLKGNVKTKDAVMWHEYFVTCLMFCLIKIVGFEKVNTGTEIFFSKITRHNNFSEF